MFYGLTGGHYEGIQRNHIRGDAVLLRAAYVVLPAFLFLSSVSASAGDYAVSYALDTGDLIEAARTEKCEYRQECKINLEKAELTISLAFWKPDHNEVRVEVSGRRLGCCYFADGEESVRRDVRGTTIRLPVFEGRARNRMNSFKTSLSVLCIFDFRTQNNLTAPLEATDAQRVVENGLG